MIKILENKEIAYHGAKSALKFCCGLEDGPGSQTSAGSSALSPEFASLLSIHTAAACNIQIIM